VLGVLTAWARVYLGVHWPFDMLGSFIVAGAGAIFAAAVRPFATARVVPLVERLYHRVLDTLRLPLAVFPRHISSVG
jgi:undecaprenyl-diphosphatase